MENETVDERELPQIPLHDFLGVPMDTSTSLSADGNTFRIEVPLTEKMQGAAMPVHGGVLSALMDIACGNVASGPDLWNRGAVPVTTDLHIRYYRQPSKGPLIVEAHARRKGRRLISVDCSVSDGEGRELTSSTASYMVIEGALPPL